MKTIQKLGVLLIMLSTFEALGQNDFTANLLYTKLVSDSVSRYSEPKISPDGTKILTSRNKETLIYIDLKQNIEVELATTPRNGHFSLYHWLDDNQIYYYKSSENNSLIEIELGRIKLNPFQIEIDTILTRKRNSSNNLGRIPFLIQGKYNVYVNLKKGKVYRVLNDKEIEITHKESTYFNLLISNNEDRIIISMNDGKNYNYDFNGSGENFVVAQGIVSSWSPNDDYLIYFKDSGGENGAEYLSELYICTSDGKHQQQLTNTRDLIELYPDWSKNSDKITFIDDTSNQIYIGTIHIE
jgi:Tol biopolymer transport system component